MRAVFLLVFCAGCSNLLGLDDPQLVDAGTGDIDAPTDGPEIDAPANTVTGRTVYRINTVAAGVVEVPVDRSNTVIQALLPDGAEPSGYRVVNGTGQADGTFVINDVPDGQPYLLKINRTYFHTDDHTIDEHYDTPVRYMPASDSGTTTVDFTISAMTSFVNGPPTTNDAVEIFSFAAGYMGQLGDVGHNASALANRLDWRNGIGIAFAGDPLPDAAMGDDLHVFHTRTEELPFGVGRKLTASRVLDWFDAGSVTVADGVNTPIAGAFTPATNNRTLMINYSRGNYDSSFPPNFEPIPSLAIYAHPIANDYNWGVPLLAVNFYDWSRSTSLTAVRNVDYADPLPAGWGRMLYESYFTLRYIRLPGTTVPRSLGGGIDRSRVLPPGMPTLTPSLTPPGMVRIAGLDAQAGGNVPFDGVAPVTMTWAAVPTAKVYTISVQRVFANGNQTRTQSAGFLHTTGTSIAIPAEVFTGGEFFTFIVTAVSTPADYAGGEIALNGIPNTFARVTTNLFRFSALCGNNTLDTGEQCDTGGTSATCDADCSMPLCGDGFANAAVGEQCDHVRNTLGCDEDCTLPVCGDGFQNHVLEDCDDGNTTDDGNGCSIECKFNNQCGDGQVQPLVEQCDSGGVDTAACDRDCTAAECGDGYVNTFSEQCDAGFSNGAIGSGCDVNCQVAP